MLEESEQGATHVFEGEGEGEGEREKGGVAMMLHCSSVLPCSPTCHELQHVIKLLAVSCFAAVSEEGQLAEWSLTTHNPTAHQ